MIAPGSLLGPYEILANLGSGGMGVVYKARDVRLGRPVAIKVLPADVAGDDDRLRRFEQEARAVSALNHPNILIVHDIGSHEGLPYIVSELLEGETLRRQLAAGSVPIRRALDYAMQMATGLAAAHDKGIVHRDLKPENLFLTDDHRIKILDFGLARITRPETASADVTDVPTETVVTEAVMGTVSYMSPEQIRGLTADRRSDVFSFGIILYELVTGTRPFKGETSVDTMTAILTKDPLDVPNPFRTLPQPLARIIEHCLQKRPEERFQSARDVLFALETFSSLPNTDSVVGRTHGTLRARVALFALGLLAASGAAGFFIAQRIAVPPAVDPVFQQLTARRGFVFSARFTPDGQSVVYGAAWDGRTVELFITRASRAESIALPSPSADVLAVSPSGELALSLGRGYVTGFASAGTLARGAAGAAPREILDDVQDADWDGNEELAIIRRVGGQHRLEWPIGRVVHSTAGWISQLRLSPERDLVGFLAHPVHGDDRGAVAVIDRQGAMRILSDGWASLNGLAWSSSTREVWFSASRGSVRRELFGVSLAGKVRSLWQGPGSVTLYDVAPDGRLLLGQESLRSIVSGVAPGERDERYLSWTDFSLGHDLSNDGRTVLLSEGGVGTSPLYDAYLRRMDGSPATRLGEGQPMALSPDQKWVLILRLTSPPELLLLPTRAGSPRRLPRGRIQEYSYVASWFPDGKRVLFQGREGTGRDRLYAQSVDGGEPVAITPEGVHLTIFTDPISPDGRRVAALDHEGRVRLYSVEDHTATAVPGLAAGEAPLLWSRDGNSLFTVERLGAARMRVNKVDLRTRRKTLIRDIAPPIAGLMSLLHVQAAMDASAYIYSYWQRLSDLYVVDGIR
jgi:hypothetical protein